MHGNVPFHFLYYELQDYVRYYIPQRAAGFMHWIVSNVLLYFFGMSLTESLERFWWAVCSQSGNGEMHFNNITHSAWYHPVHEYRSVDDKTAAGCCSRRFSLPSSLAAFLRRVFASSFISLFLRLSHFRSGLTARRGAAPLQLYHTCLTWLPAPAQRPQPGSRHPLFTVICVPSHRPWPRGGQTQARWQASGGSLFAHSWVLTVSQSLVAHLCIFVVHEYYFSHCKWASIKYVRRFSGFLTPSPLKRGSKKPEYLRRYLMDGP